MNLGKSSWKFVTVALLATAFGCGPAAIGAGVSSISGGGGGATSSGPIVLLETVPVQPFDDATVLGLRLGHPDGRDLRLRFEYEAAGGRVRIPARSIALFDIDSRTDQPLPVVDASGNAVLSAPREPVQRFFLWRHAADLGVVEQREVGVYAVYADARATPPDFAAEQGASIQLFKRAIGRELAELTDLEASRASADPESAVQLQATLLDRADDFAAGDDRATTRFTIEYATTASPPAAADFTALPSAAPVQVVRSIEGDRVRYRLTWSFDPLAGNVPLGGYSAFWLRIQHQETYPQVRSDLPTSVKVGAQVVLALGAQQFGQVARIERITVADPGSPATAIGEFGRPWLRLPVTLTLYNPSGRVNQRVRLSGSYRIGAEGAAFRPMTPFFTGEPQSAAEIELAPLERRNQYLVWNVVRDEGLGNLPFNPLDPPNPDPSNPPRVAEVKASLRLVAATVPALPPLILPLGGSPLESESQAPNQFSTLSTAPFVAFRENLLPAAVRVWSAGEDLAQRTRDLFFTEFFDSQERRIRLDQQFEAKQIVPPPPPYELLPSQFGSGVFAIVPTDFVSARPDCLVWAGTRFTFVSWPTNGGPAIPEAAGEEPLTLLDGSAGIQPQVFSIGTGANRHDVVVFFRWREQPFGPGKRLQVRLAAVTRNAGGQWSVVPAPIEVRDIARSADIRMNAVNGEFDGDPATHEVVLGAIGGEYAAAAPAAPGLLDMWRFRVGASGVEIDAPVPLAKPPLPVAEPGREINKWILSKWRDSAEIRDDLCLVRQLLPSGPRPLEVDVHLLRRQASGGLAPAWQIESDELGNGALSIGGELDRVFALDLDGGVEGNPGSDLILIFRNTVSGTQFSTSAIWLYTRATTGPLRWRRLFDGLRVQDPFTLALADGQFSTAQFQLVDVNGDRLLDLVTAERFVGGSDLLHYNYLSSSLSGVAGRIDGLGESAGAPFFRSSLPGLLDANADGLTDVISGGRLHTANLDGTFTQGPGGFGTGADLRHRVERIFLNAPADTIEVVLSDPGTSAQNRIVQISGLGGGQAPFVLPLAPYDFGGAVREVRAVAAADAESRQRKDLVAIVGSVANGALHMGRFDATGFAAAPLSSASIDSGIGLALVRRGNLVAGRSPALDSTPQDIVVGENLGGSARRLLVFEVGNGLQARVLPLPAGHVPRRIAEGSASTDSLEDLLVLTRSSLAWHVLAFLQSSDAAVGVVAPPVELLRFQSPFDNAEPRAFAFSQARQRLCEGFVLFDDGTPGSPRSEVRLIYVSDDPAGLSVRLVRSPLSQSVDNDVRVVVGDNNQDGVLEVIGGEVGTQNGLRRLRANIRPPSATLR